MSTLVLSADKILIPLVVLATAYCPCPQCTYPYTDGITTSGAPAVEGVTIAAGPEHPLGTEVVIKGVGHRVVQDRGGAIHHGRIDVYFDCHDRALDFGRHQLIMWVEKNK